MKKELLITLGLACSTTLGHAALSAIANGDFESDVTLDLGGNGDSSVGSAPAGTDWYESDIGGFSDVISDSNNAVFAAQLRPNGFIHIQNNGGSGSYIYQNLGTLGSEASASFTFDALERVQGNGDFTTTISLFASTSFSGANGTDISGAAGVTALGSGDYRFLSDSVLATNDDVIGASIPNLSLAGATAGDTIWVRVGTPRPAGDATMNIDNLAVTYVPEPGSAALLGLGCLSLLFRRSRR